MKILYCPIPHYDIVTASHQAIPPKRNNYDLKSILSKITCICFKSQRLYCVHSKHSLLAKYEHEQMEQLFINFV